eukprot:TRINITY_DN13703_c0_g1_i1.p1 TRINITY_DN13703_c0_g1~~TRINITY_DN13703_c0_g1_i1.p1  ORF type:complete len:509 (+),score=133.08 TRINITY_DN13703_c0_g1_i1:46-1572(+)
MCIKNLYENDLKIILENISDETFLQNYKKCEANSFDQSIDSNFRDLYHLINEVNSDYAQKYLSFLMDYLISNRRYELYVFLLCKINFDETFKVDIMKNIRILPESYEIIEKINGSIPLNLVSMSNDKKYLFVSNLEEKSFLFNALNFEVLKHFDFAVEQCSWSFDSTKMLLNSCGMCKLIDIQNLTEIWTNESDSDCTGYIIDGRNFFITVQGGVLLKKIDLNSLDTIQTLNFDLEILQKVVISSDGDNMAICGNINEIIICEIDSFKILTILPKSIREQLNDIANIVLIKGRLIVFSLYASELILIDYDLMQIVKKKKTNGYCFFSRVYYDSLISTIINMDSSGFNMDGNITIFDLNTLDIIQEIDVPGFTLAFYLDNKNKYIYFTGSTKEFAVNPISNLSFLRRFKVSLFSKEDTFIYDDNFVNVLVKYSQTIEEGILSRLPEFFKSNKFIRLLISKGFNIVDQNEFLSIKDVCWDLADLNKENGGNLSEFLDYLCKNEDISDDDD